MRLYQIMSPTSTAGTESHCLVLPSLPMTFSVSAYFEPGLLSSSRWC